jgi:hypothetical protein
MSLDEERELISVTEPRWGEGDTYSVGSLRNRWRQSFDSGEGRETPVGANLNTGQTLWFWVERICFRRIGRKSESGRSALRTKGSDLLPRSCLHSRQQSRWETRNSRETSSPFPCVIWHRSARFPRLPTKHKCLISTRRNATHFITGYQLYL